MNEYKKPIEKGEKLFRKIAGFLTKDNSVEGISSKDAASYKEWSNVYESISANNAWRKVWFLHNKTKIYSVSAAAVILLLVSLLIFLPKGQQAETYVVEQIIMPASDNIILKTSKGKTINVDSVQSLDTIISNVALSNTGIIYEKESQEIDRSGEEVKTGKTSDDLDEMNELYVPKGRVFSLVLSDGSKVWLNSESYIKYPVTFSKGERIVTISGEAFFDIAKDGSKFIVKTSGYDVNVLGTKFNLMSYENDDVTATTLLEGSVSLTTGEESEFKISPGEQFSLEKSSNIISIKKVDVNLYSSWVDNQLKLSNSKLNDIFKVLQRKYDIHVFFRDEKAKNELYSGVVPLNDNLKIILDQISKVSAVEFQIQGKLVIITYK